MNLLHSVRRWFWSVKLTLLERAMASANDDMADALHAQDYGAYRALAEFHTDLAIEALHLRARLGLSAFPFN